jgi:RNA-binding protein
MLIIQCDAAQLPGLYSEVMDRRTKPVGKIMDVFGNVKSPYALVLSHGQCCVRPGEKVYAREPRTPATGRSGSIRTQQ